MRPIPNDFQFPWDIGETLIYAGSDEEDSEIIIKAYIPCQSICKQKGCIHYLMVDQSDTTWCCIEHDFERI